jgi:hypothetical protein
MGQAQLLITQTAFSFAELSESAKETIREQYANLEYDWWDSTYEDFQTICETLHIDIDTIQRTGRSGKTYNDPKIFFSGFCSQGDGASWAGTVYLDRVGDTLTRVQDYAPLDETLHGIATRLDSLTAMFRLKIGEHHADVTSRVEIDTSSSNYCHSGTMTASAENMISDIESVFDSEREAEDIKFFDSIEDDVLAIARALADWLYGALEKEHDYLTSDECIIERGEEYDEDGEWIQ